MIRMKLLLGIVLTIILLVGQVGAVLAAPLSQDVSPIHGTVQGITLESDAATGVMTVVVDVMNPNQLVQQVRLTQETAIALGLVLLDGDGNPVINKKALVKTVEIDPATDGIVTRTDLPGAKGNHGLLFAPEQRLAFIACEDNDKLLVLDMRTMKVAASFDVGGNPDVLAFDPGPRLLYVAGEKGVVSMFSVAGSKVSKIGDGRVGPNAHVVNVDATKHRSWFPLKSVDGHPVLRIMAPR